MGRWQETGPAPDLLACCSAMSRKTVAEREKDELAASIVDYFSRIPDPRVERTRRHSLVDILVLSLCAVISGADSFCAIEAFGRARKEWLQTFMDLRHGIPTHDTLGRLFAALDPQTLAEAFRRWALALARLTRGEVVAIDGKTLRRSFQEAGSSAFVHMVSAWAAGNGLVLGQVKTEEKSNEITAIPRLLELLSVKGCLVTIDAMGCQKQIAEDIRRAGAEYLLAVKDNQPTLSVEVRTIFEHCRREPTAFSVDFHETRETGHGRAEVRRCWTTDMVESLSHLGDWHGVRSLAMIESERTVAGQTSIECRYFISSRKSLSAENALRAVRSHWGIENQLHWVLDVVFREDDCRVRAGNAAENFAVLRHLSLNLLKSVKDTKLSVRLRRMTAGWDQDFLLKVLTAQPDVG
jgi:predicted transposase YbfD/YdcC